MDGSVRLGHTRLVLVRQQRKKKFSKKKLYDLRGAAVVLKRSALIMQQPMNSHKAQSIHYLS